MTGHERRGQTTFVRLPPSLYGNMGLLYYGIFDGGVCGVSGRNL